VSLTADAVKAKARALGADLVGIAHGGVLDRHPPDPARPQTPTRITPDDSKSAASTLLPGPTVTDPPPLLVNPFSVTAAAGPASSEPASTTQAAAC